MRHAISYHARNWVEWPSIQEASEMLKSIIEAQVCTEGGPSSPSVPSVQVSQAA